MPDGLREASDAVERFSQAIEGLGLRGTKPNDEMNKIELTAGIAKATCESLKNLISPLDMVDEKLALIIIPQQALRIESLIIQARSGQIMPRSEKRMLNEKLRESYLIPLLGLSRAILNKVKPCPHRPLPLPTAQEEEL